MSNGHIVVVVGGSSLPGQEFLKLLAERSFPVGELRLLDSSRFAGQRISFAQYEVEIAEMSAHAFRDASFAFFFTSSEVSTAFVPQAVASGALVVDCSPAFRLEPGVPLVVPEVNAGALRRGLVASPSPAAVQLLAAIHPLHQANPLKALVVDTLHAVSETGSAAMEELSAQTRQVLQGHAAVPHVYAHQIAFNLLPETDVFLDNGYTRAEWQLRGEIRKVLGTPELPISATGVRVPVHIGNSQIVYAEFSHAITPDDVRAILSRAAGIRIADDPVVSLYPQPWTVVGENEVFVGRIREDTARPYGIAMWVVADNLRRGSALNALQIAESALDRKLF
ncbi:MAG: aspartate-semialdehyde dehydrogenase [Bacteroidetes bacterium]|nr:aspartate-semialdehyde dehydrogenase [Bacteroidota bacterium]